MALAAQSLTNSYPSDKPSAIFRQVRTRRDYLVFQREEQEKEEDDCGSHGGGASAFAILNFIISSISVASSVVSNTNSNSNNNNNNNNDNNNNDNNVNVANNNNLLGNMNQVMFLPGVGKRRRSWSSDGSAAFSRLAIASMTVFMKLEACRSHSCQASILCAEYNSRSGAAAQHILEGSKRHFDLNKTQC